MEDKATEYMDREDEKQLKRSRKHRSFYFSNTEDSKKFIEQLNKKLGPIYDEFLDMGYNADEISHGICQWCYDKELNVYLDIE